MRVSVPYGACVAALLAVLALGTPAALADQPPAGAIGAGRYGLAAAAGALAALGGAWFYTRRGKRHRPAGAADAVATIRQLRHDPLTHLANRRAFDEKIAAQLAHGKPFAVLALDIDHFGSLNDRIGFANGDMLLQQVGDRLRRALTEKSGAAHVFSDIFAILADGHPQPEDPEALALHLLRACEEPFVCDGEPLTISVSIGIARAPAHGSTASALLSAATHALRTTKSTGPGRWGFYQGNGAG